MVIPNSVVGEENIEELAEKIQEEFDKEDYGAGSVGSSGKKPANKSSKTVRGLRDQVMAASANHSQKEIKAHLATELKNLLMFVRHDPTKREVLIADYLDWLNDSIKQRSVVWKEAEIEFDQFGARGPGGQNVNKSQTAVRSTHTPSMIKATNQDSKDLQQNKEESLAVLKGRLEIHLNRWRNYLHAYHGAVRITPDVFWDAIKPDENF